MLPAAGDRFETALNSVKRKQLYEGWKRAVDKARSGLVPFFSFCVRAPLMKRVIGIDLVKLDACRRVVGVAGGVPEMNAILGTLRGGLLDVLITDQRTAEALPKAQK